jgi:hypothetical protein
MTEDLWPVDLQPVQPVRTPVGLLKEQAALLGPKTDNILEAYVSTHKLEVKFGDESFWTRFLIVAPTLEYHYEVFSITYGITLYPVRTESGEILNDENELKSFLQRQLQSDKTRKVVGALIAQVRDQSA